MDTIIVLNREQALNLLAEMNVANSKGNYGLRNLRICMDGNYVKFKVNEFGWSPPMGELDPDCRAAARKRVEENNANNMD